MCLSRECCTSGESGRRERLRVRGISNSGHRAALQGGLDYTHTSGWYAGTWLSNVDFSDGGQARSEVDIYAGHTVAALGLDWDASVLSFNYPGTAKSLKYASYKYRLDVRRSLPLLTVGAYYDLYHDYFGSGVAHYLEALVLIPLPEGFNLDLRLGRQRLTDNAALGLPDYTQRSVTLLRRSGDWEARLGCRATARAVPSVSLGRTGAALS